MKSASKSNMSSLKMMEFGEIAELRKEKFNPVVSNEDKHCIELEHIEQETGNILGWVPASEQKSIKNVFKKGDVLFGKLRPYLRKYWLATFDGVCSSEIWVLKPKTKEITKNYLFNLVQTHEFVQVANVASGSKMPRADWDYVSCYPVQAPPLPEQKAIAQLLSTWDEAIQKLTRLIAQKQQRKKWLMQMLLSGKKRLKGFKGEWKRTAFESLLMVVKRPVVWDDSEIYDLISVRRRSGGIFFRESLPGSKIMVKDLRYVEEGDFLFSKMQIVHGASALVTKEFVRGKISGSYIAVVPKNVNDLNIEYFNWYSKTARFYHQTFVSSYGVHIEKMTFDFQSFLSQDLHLPPLPEQTAIANILQTADNEINLLQQKLSALKAQKKGLMQQLLTGKKRLKHD
ncbi:MAG: restriction endonuclease subunit S [Chitinophagaceae bacterium]